MFVYEKKLQYPINIKTPNAKAAKVIMTQLGGPDGELGAALRYLSQRYTAPYGQVKALLTDIGTEELGHVEMIGTLVYQLTRNLSVDQIKEQGFDDYFVDHTAGVYPVSAAGVPFSVAPIASKGDIITDLVEDMAAEQVALHIANTSCFVFKYLQKHLTKRKF
jgi:spore coat protein JC